MKNYTVIPGDTPQDPVYEYPNPIAEGREAGASARAKSSHARSANPQQAQEPTPRSAQQPGNAAHARTRYTQQPASHPAQQPGSGSATSSRPQTPDSKPNVADGSLTPDAALKLKGTAQMAAGAVVAAAGVPMLILPGPGAAAIAGGVALASKGQRNFSGREATAVEEKLDAAADVMAAIAKEQAEATAQKIAAEAPIVAEKAAVKAGAIAGSVARAASDAVPVVMSSVEENMPAVAEATRKTAAVVKDAASVAVTAGEMALDAAPSIVRKAAYGLDAVVSLGKASFGPKGKR